MPNERSPRLLAAGEQKEASVVLSTAFQSDPLWCYLYPDPQVRAVYLRRCFSAILAYALPSGRAYGAGEPLSAVAVWELPNQPPAKLSWRALGSFAALGAGSFVLKALKVRSVFGAFDRMHRQYATAPHIYLQTIGVMPNMQGQGLSSALIRPFLRQADARGLGAYTETMTPANVGLYEHFGLKCMEEVRIPGTDLCAWGFYRKPIAPT
jgi:GNAT superfamily N-acetyltransferase